MTDEGGDITIGNNISNSRVDQVGEDSDIVLEVVVDDLRDTGGELKDGNLWRDFQLADHIKKTISWNTSIGVDCSTRLAIGSSSAQLA